MDFAATRPRNRFLSATAVLFVIGVGLASRKFHGIFPELLGKYPGDALWALMIFYLWAVVCPSGRTRSIALLALSTSFAVELSQLYQAPWIVSIRSTTLGHLILGSRFSSIDLIAYTVGVAFGAGGDLIRQARTKR